MKPLVIGIAGKSGSGKTTLAQELVNSYNNDITIIRLDDYYKSQDHLDIVQRTLTNYDHPDAFDWDLLSNDLALLIEENQLINLFMIMLHILEVKSMKLLLQQK